MKDKLQFIDMIEPRTARTSSLAINGNRSNRDLLTVIGGLQHQASIEPRSIRDAEVLIEWLQDWKKRKVETP